MNSKNVLHDSMSEFDNFNFFMSDQNILPSKYNELRNIFKYYIDSYIALYWLKAKSEEELNSIYNKIKIEMIDSKKYPPQRVIEDILGIIPYNNRYTKSYLEIAKHISDDYHVIEVNKVEAISNYLFYKEYGIKICNAKFLLKQKLINVNVHSENTIYKAIMDNDLETFILFTETDGFDKTHKPQSSLYPRYYKEYSLLELCCYHGSVDCFKLLRSKFNSEITRACLELSFLGENQEIMSECLKHHKPDKECMKYAIISHNIDFVTFLMNEYKIEINLIYCGVYNDLDSFLVYFDQTNDINKCFVYSSMFDIPYFCEYFLSLGVNINEKDEDGNSALHYAVVKNCKETAEILISYGININQNEKRGLTALHHAAFYNNKEIVNLLIANGANINEKEKYGKTPLLFAASNINKETAELLISYGANINENDNFEYSALHIATLDDNKEVIELLISHGINLNEKK